MAATFTESQQLDYLFKKIGYGVAKTAEPSALSAANEGTPSPLLYRGDLVWAQSGSIPSTPPASTTSIVQVYTDTAAVQTTEIPSAPDNQSWTTNLTNWIPTQFGPNYLVRVYAGPPGAANIRATGTQLNQSGSGVDDTWFFDYQAGIINFNGANIPTAIGTSTANTVYVMGYTYVGVFGVGGTTQSSISNGTSNVSVVSSGGNVTVGVGGTGNVAVFASTGAYITGVASVSGNITSANVNTGIVSVSGNVVAANVNTGIMSATGNVVAGNVNTSILSATGNVVAGNLNAAGLSLSSNVVSNFNVTANIAGGNITTPGLISATGNISGNYFIGNGSALTSTMTDRGSDNNNWDLLTQMGVYTVNRTSWAGTSNTPLDSQVFVGLLEVKNSTNTAIEQIFYPGTVDITNIKIQWNRAYWAGTWTAWIQMTNDGQTVSGGDFT
jgi:hypothetical protein